MATLHHQNSRSCQQIDEMTTAGDEQYMMDESEHVDRLRDCDVRQLGVLIDDSAPGLGDWKTLAAHLAVDNADVRYAV